MLRTRTRHPPRQYRRTGRASPALQEGGAGFGIGWAGIRRRILAPDRDPNVSGIWELSASAVRLHSRGFRRRSGRRRVSLVAIGKDGATLRRLRALFNVGAIRELSDGQLLERFATG